MQLLRNFVARTRTRQPQLLIGAVGLIFLALGISLLSAKETLLSGFLASILCVLGAQALLWAVGIRSTLLGTTTTADVMSSAGADEASYRRSMTFYTQTSDGRQLYWSIDEIVAQIRQAISRAERTTAYEDSELSIVSVLSELDRGVEQRRDGDPEAKFSDVARRIHQSIIRLYRVLPRESGEQIPASPSAACDLLAHAGTVAPIVAVANSLFWKLWTVRMDLRLDLGSLNYEVIADLGERLNLLLAAPTTGAYGTNEAH